MGRSEWLVGVGWLGVECGRGMRGAGWWDRLAGAERVAGMGRLARCGVRQKVSRAWDWLWGLVGRAW